MNTDKLQKIIINELEETKAENIKTLNINNSTILFDKIIIASSKSKRHTKALAFNICKKIKKYGQNIIGIEGQKYGKWILVDCIDIIVHIIQPNLRKYYKLDEL